MLRIDFPDPPSGFAGPSSSSCNSVLIPQNSALFGAISHNAARRRLTSRDLAGNRMNWTQIVQSRVISPVLARALQISTDHSTQNEVKVLWRDRPF